MCRRRCPAGPQNCSARRRQCPRAVAEVGIGGAGAGDGHVEASISVEIAGHDRKIDQSRRVGEIQWGRDRRLKRPVPIARQNEQLIVTVRRDGQVELAVTGEVASHDRPRRDPHPAREVHGGGLECPIAVTQEHVHAAGINFVRRTINLVAGIGDGQVELAVAGEVASHQSRRARSRPVSHRGLERAIAVAQEHAHTAGAVRRHH